MSEEKEIDFSGESPLNDGKEEKTPEQLCEEYLGGWKRALADYQNLKKESDEKFREGLDMGVIRMISAVTPIYNNLTQAFSHIPPDQLNLPWVIGLKHIKANFDELWKTLGLVQIKTVGEAMDPNIHEVVDEAEEGEGESGKIIREVSAGFTRNGKVIMPAKVIVKK